MLWPILGESSHSYRVTNAELIRGAVLLFVTFLAALLLFTTLLIRLSRFSERHRGLNKEDPMVGEGMRWAEGKEIIEHRAHHERRTVSTRGGKSGEAWNGREELPPVPRRAEKMVRRQSGVKMGLSG